MQLPTTEEIISAAKDEFFDTASGQIGFVTGAKWALEKYAEHLEVCAWVSVEERLPERNDNVLVLRAAPFHKYQITGFQRDGTFYSNETASKLENATHWRPLPTPPTK